MVHKVIIIKPEGEYILGRVATKAQALHWKNSIPSNVNVKIEKE